MLLKIYEWHSLFEYEINGSASVRRQDVLGTTLLPTLCSLLSELAIVSLKLFKAFLDSLSSSDISRPQDDWVLSLSTVWHQSLARVDLDNLEPDFILLTDIPVALFVKVGEAHIVTIDITDLFTIHVDLAAHVILSLHAILAGLIDALDLVFLIGESDLACQLMTHRTHDDVEYVVTSIVKSDFLAIFEGDFFVT